MPSNLPRSRSHTRTVERLIALAESYGCRDVEALRADVDVVIRVEVLTWERAVRSAEERWRRKVTPRGVKSPPQG